jgi:hypothetical protein
MMQVMDRAVPLASIRPDLPADVCQLISDLMEKERTARPADAEQVISRVTAMREELGDDDAEFESDRETVMAKDRPDAVSLTRFDKPTEESDRATILTPERMARLAAPNTVAARPVGQPWGPPAGQQWGPPAGQQWGPPARQPAPAWPVPPPRRRRSVWPGVVSSLITAAIVAGVGAYYWFHIHEALKVTNLNLTAAKQEVGCEGTANLIGTISTNGRGGPVSYEWVLNGDRQGVLKATDGSGIDTVKVTESWTFHGKGTGRNIAELDILGPQQTSSSFTFPYSCPQ